MSVRYEISNEVTIITLDDGKANALSDEMIEEINSALDQAEANARSVVIAGRPDRFSAGFDLKVMGESRESAAQLVNAGGQLFLRIFSFPLPVIAACTGHAMAGGALLLLTCDTRIGVKGDYKICLNETAIGMALPKYGLELPRARLDPRHFTAAVIQSQIHDPEMAVKAGFLDLVKPANEVLDTAIKTAELQGTLPRDAYHANKLGMRSEAIKRIKDSLTG